MATLDLHYGTPSDWAERVAEYIPVSITQIDRYLKQGLTVFDLEELAFDNIPPEFTDARIEIGKRLEKLGKNAILHAYGPIEGDYYIEISEPDIGMNEIIGS